MTPADDLPPAQLVGQHIAFKADVEHHTCWHYRIGVKTGTVLKKVPTLAQKAELLAAEGIDAAELADQEEVARLWIKADPCPSFPRGCELAAEPACLLLK